MGTFGLREFRIVRLSDHASLEALANRPHLPDAVCWDLASASSSMLRGRVAANSTLPIDAIVLMAGDESADVRASVARNSSAPGVTLSDLSRDASRQVLEAVAGNAATPVDLLCDLAATPRLRANVARNPALPVNLLREWVQESGSESSHAEWVLLSAIGANPSVPEDAMERCMGIAEERPDEEDSLAEDRELVRIGLASNPNVPPALLTSLAMDGWRVVRANVAGNPSAPPELLAQLAEDGEEEVRRHVARNLSTPVRVLIDLHRSEQPTSWVHEDLMANPHLPQELIGVYVDALKRRVIANPALADDRVWNLLERILYFSSGPNPAPWADSSL